MATNNKPSTRNKPSKIVLNEKYEQLTTEINKFNQIDLSDLKEDYESLKNVAKQVKTTLKEYLEISNQLSKLLIDEAALEESQDVRESRSHARNDCKEIIRTLNCYISELRRTNISDITSGDHSTYATPAPTDEEEISFAEPEDSLSHADETIVQEVDPVIPPSTAVTSCIVTSQNQFQTSFRPIRSTVDQNISDNTFNFTNISDTINSCRPKVRSDGNSFNSKIPLTAPTMPVYSIPGFNNRFSNDQYVSENFNTKPFRATYSNPITVPTTTISDTINNTSRSHFTSQPHSYRFDEYSNLNNNDNTNINSYVPMRDANRAPHRQFNPTNHASLSGNQYVTHQPMFDTNYASHYQPNASYMSAHTDALSTFLLTQDLVRKSITPFDGSPINFHPWLNKIRDLIKMLKLTPLQTLQLFESHTTGEPQKMITLKLASTGSVSPADIDDVYDTLHRRYGSTQKITQDILDKINNFPTIRNPNIGDKLEELCDLCKIVLHNSSHCPELRLMDLSVGLSKVRAKLPEFVQREWAKVGQHYEDMNGCHPPFTFFVEFVKKQAKLQSNRNYETIVNTFQQQKKPPRVLRTSASPERTNPEFANKKIKENSNEYCLFHKSKTHSLQNCTTFKGLEFPKRKQFIYESRLCYICLGHHRAASCSSEVKCEKCDKRHHSVMHREFTPQSDKNTEKESPVQNSSNRPVNENSITALCTKVCNDKSKEMNCSKTLLVELSMKSVPDKKIKAYCIIDEQSNCTLVDESVPEYFGKTFPTQSFTMKFASQNFSSKMESGIVTGLQVRGILSNETIDINEAITCPNIADTTQEVATPSIVSAHDTIKKYTHCFPEFDPEARVLLLIGRDCGRAMSTECLNSNSSSGPYVHRSPLGYSLVGNVCKNTPNGEVSVFRTQVETFNEPITVEYNFTVKKKEDVFHRRPDDDHPGLSNEDKVFIETMNSGVTTTPEGNLELPLPFKGIDLPNNMIPVYSRTHTTLTKLKTNKKALDECLQSMDKSLNAKYVEQIPEAEIETTNPTWYLPIFGVNQIKKKKTRLVYDASARYKNISLNDTLMTGPDLNNHLRSVLLKFREKPIAFAADIESMFSTFKVPRQHQDLLRFFWFQGNDPVNPLVPYRSTSHLFGCSCSPAVANFALKYCASSHNIEGDLQDAVDYLHQSFYVDDGVSSVDSPSEATKIISGAMKILSSYNIRLHKIVSNNLDVLKYFPDTEVATCELERTRILGVSWNTSDDTFVVEAPASNKPYTRRGILSFNNSFYDPVGFISPLLLSGRLFQRKVLPPKEQTTEELRQLEWDEEIPKQFHDEWNTIARNLENIDEIKLNRSLYSSTFKPKTQELHVFSDASDVAIGHVAYMRSIDEENNVEVTFVTASSRVAPRSATTIPRLELCAAVEAANCLTKITSDLSVKPNKVKLYTDSNIVLGYINNSVKRFTKYVERRVAVIQDHTTKEDWEYVNTLENPADIASRPCYDVKGLLQSRWLKGPSFLYATEISTEKKPSELIENLPEEIINKEITTMKTTMTKQSILHTLYEKTKGWSKLIGITKIILKMISISDVAKQRLGKHLAPRNPFVSQEDAILFIVRQSQEESFPEAMSILRQGKPLPDSYKISKLSPYLGNDDSMRVGGRLKNSKLTFHIKHPLLIPRQHPICDSIIQHYHDYSKHQGNYITHSVIINNGFHLEDGRQSVREHINKCVMCRKLRGKSCQQLMADLPADRLEETTPFENVGLDVFGPFYIHEGATTRRGNSTKKIWVVIFVCLPSRAVHLEPLVGMDTSSFRNALSRFVAMRGPVKIIRSDQGTNFISAKKQLNQEQINVDELTKTLNQQDIKWILNPPHASHHGGTWERKIGSVRRVLEASFRLTSNRGLSRDEFTTVLAEASSIVNQTPLWTVSHDPNDPTPLTPQMLLTLKGDNTNTVEDFSEKDLLAYGTRRYRRVQYLCDQFWLRWRREYVQSLNLRQKWRKEKPSLRVGDVVLLKDKQTARNHWPIARIQSVKTGEDGLVRSATLLLHKPGSSFATRTLTRPITDMILLVSSPHDNA